MYTRRLSSVYSKQISTSRNISRGSTLINNPRVCDINYGINKISLLGTNFKATCKKIIKSCYWCKRFNISHYPKLSQGLIPTDTTKQVLPFSVIAAEYAGPFICKTKGKRDIKVYLLLFTCSLTRAVHLEILSNQTTQEFKQALKQLISRRGIPKVIHSDNAKTFQKASNWIKRVYKD